MTENEKKIKRKKIYFMIFSCSYVIFKVPCIERQREGDKMMRYSSLLLSPKREEQHVPDSFLTKFSDAKQVYGDEDMDIMDGLEGFLGIEEEEEEEDERKIIPGKSVGGAGHFNWDFMDWELEEEEEEEEELGEQNFKEEDHYGKVIKTENYGFWDGDHEKMMSLNLNLNYQDVLEAWSDRGSLWADECSLSITNSTCYMGEVPIMEEEKSRREASVMRYKEKRQTRLFSKKIRYQVRKLNADKRPRLKGRFVKRVPDQKMVKA